MNHYNNQVLDKHTLLLYDNSRTVHCITFIFCLNERGIFMKRRDFLKLSAAAALAGAAAACGAAPAASASSAQVSSLTASSASSAASAASSAASASAQAAGSRTLVACYSATGNTAAVAGYIADATGADLFLVQPVDPYTDEELNYNDSGSRVSQEHADPALQTVELEATTPDGWADYDTVFVGYPIWWGQAGWPLNGFVTGNDFAGKRVILFCTSASSGLGSSAQNLAQLAGSGDWQEGMRFRSSASAEDVAQWLAGLSL